MSDHNYSKVQSDEDGEIDDCIYIYYHHHINLFIPTTWLRPSQKNNSHRFPSWHYANENFHEHPSCSYSQSLSSVTECLRDAVSEQFLCSSNLEIELPSTSEHTANESYPLRKVKTVPVSSKKNKIIKQMTRIASDSLGLTAPQRINKAIVYSNNENLLKNFKFLSKQAQTFLLMQLRLCRQNKMARWFTMEEKLQCLVLLKQSPKSYKLLENMFALPNKRTLHHLSEKISIEPGFNTNIFQFIRNKIKSWNTNQKLCTIIFYEISLTPHLTYNEKSDKIHGFVDVAGERKMKFCDHALVFMIRGVCSSWRQTMALYFCEGTVPAAALQNILKQLVSEVAQIGLIPLGLVCDQGSNFKTALKAFRDNTVRERILENVKCGF